MQAWKNWFFEQGPEIVVSLASALIILGVGFLAARLASRVLKRALSRGKIGQEKMLIGLICKAARAVVVILAAIIALEKIGVSVAPFIAGLGVSSLVFGFAFKDTLSNFASGLLLIIYRPFLIGDLVDVAGTMGTVEELSIVNTRLKSLEGPIIYLPNSAVWGAKVTNLTRSTIRRTIFEVGIDYGDDIGTAFRVIEKVVADDARILQDPAPFVRLSGLGDSSVNFQIFVYAQPGDFGSLLNDFYARLKPALEAEEISIPFPQQDIHMIGPSAGA